MSNLKVKSIRLLSGRIGWRVWVDGDAYIFTRKAAAEAFVRSLL